MYTDIVHCDPLILNEWHVHRYCTLWTHLFWIFWMNSMYTDIVHCDPLILNEWHVHKYCTLLTHLFWIFEWMPCTHILYIVTHLFWMNGMYIDIEHCEPIYSNALFSSCCNLDLFILIFVTIINTDDAGQVKLNVKLTTWPKLSNWVRIEL